MYVNQIQGQAYQYYPYYVQQPLFFQQYQAGCAGNIPTQVLRHQNQNFNLNSTPNQNFNLSQHDKYRKPPPKSDVHKTEKALNLEGSSEVNQAEIKLLQEPLKPSPLNPEENKTSNILISKLLQDVEHIEHSKESCHEKSEVPDLIDFGSPQKTMEDDDFVSIDGNNNYFSRNRNDDEEDIYSSANSIFSKCSNVSNISRRHKLLIQMRLEEIEKEEQMKKTSQITKEDLKHIEPQEISEQALEKITQHNILRDSKSATKVKSRIKLIEIAAREIRTNNKILRLAETKEEIKAIQKISKNRKDSAKNLQTISEDFDDNIEKALPLTMDFEFLSMLDMPKNVVKMGEKLPEPIFPANFVIGKCIPIFVSEVNTPFKFWFHIRKDDDELDLLMNTME